MFSVLSALFGVSARSVVRRYQARLARLSSAAASSSSAADSTSTTRPIVHGSFYKFVPLHPLHHWRSRVLQLFDSFGAKGRIYLAHEGINAQFQVPASQRAQLQAAIEAVPEFQGGVLNIEHPDHALESVYRPLPSASQLAHDPSFLAHPACSNKQRERLLRRLARPAAFDKLQVKLRPHLVASPGIAHEQLEQLEIKHESEARLSPEQWNAALEQPGAVVVDVRNYYEGAIGRFENSTQLDTDSYHETMRVMQQHVLHDKPADQPILLYCTGGVRCTKVAAYLKQAHGFTNVKQLDGGIIRYAMYAKEHPHFQSKYRGSTFVFDNRLAVEVTPDKLSSCTWCGTQSVTYQNCANDWCDALFIQCDSCAEHSERHFCSPQCLEIGQLPPDEYQRVAIEKRATREAFKSMGFSVRRLLAPTRSAATESCDADDRDAVPHCGAPLRASDSLCSHSPRSTKQQHRSYSTVTAGVECPRDATPAPVNSRALLSDCVHQYAQQHSTPLDNQRLLEELLETTKAVAANRWQQASSIAQCQLLKALVRLRAAKHVLELGTFSGMATIAMAEAVAPKAGRVITCETDQQMRDVALQHFARSSVGHVIESRLCAAADLLEALAREGRRFDVVFLDADKRNYLHYVETIAAHKLLADDGVIMADNTLYRGLVVEPASAERPRDQRQAQCLHDFNVAVRDTLTGGAQVAIVPLRDGLSLIWLS